MAVKCPKCHSENPDTKQFCADCGTQLTPHKNIYPEETETLQTPIKELTTGSTFAGRYQIIEELGKGGMGRVYKVFDAKIKEKIALKLIKPEIASDKETIERFSNEIRLARKIGHRNVCRMFDIGEAEGAHFITMEYVSGEDLKTMIRMAAGLSIGAVLSIGKQVCDGLVEAHSLGVVHRDLKPQNIMIDKGGNAKIMDFGIARSMKEKGITGPSVLIGTPEYISPEQAEAKEVDHKRAIELSPNYPTAHLWYHIFLLCRGRFDEAEAEISRAKELDPLSLIINSASGDMLYYRKKYDQAIQQYRKTLELDQNFAETRLRLGKCYLQKEMSDEAIAEFQKARTVFGNNPYGLGELGSAYALAGRKDEALKVLRDLEGPLGQGYSVNSDLALIHFALGDRDKTFEYLERAYDEKEDGVFWLKVDPCWASLRLDPRCISLIKRMELE